MAGGEEEQGGLRETACIEEGLVEEGGGREGSKTCSWFKFIGTRPAVTSTAGVTALACEGTEAAAG